MAKHKGKAKSAELSKKERKALKAREAELLAKLDRKAAKKAAAKTEPSAKAKTVEAADEVLATPGASEGAVTSAKTAKAAATEAGDDESAESIKARVKAKRERREVLEGDDYRAGIDLDDLEAVRAYNAEAAELGLGRFLTSNAERKAADKRVKGDDRPMTELTAEAAAEFSGDASDPVAVAVNGAINKVTKAKKAAKGKSADTKVEAALHGPDDEPEAAGSEPEPSPAAQAAEVVETEHGREFAVGESVAVEFANPSDAPPQLEEGRNGYKIIQLNADGKPDLKGDGTPRTVRQLTRVTTYIANLEDTTNLEKWKMRTLLEGVAISNVQSAEVNDDPVIATVADLMHQRDTAIAKAARQDRKGKLEVGERGRIEAAATKAFKDAVNALADELLELGGVHEKANRGTNLHALTELADAGKPLPDDESVTPTDRASVAAYTAACEAAGIKIVAAEVVIVNDAVGYAGRLDRVVLYKPEGKARALRVIADIKTGRIDYGLTKIEQQVAMYADGKAYDLKTGERSPIGGAAAGVDKHLGLLIHVPQGEGTAFIYELDLDRGRRGNKLSGQVREWRSESGKVSRAERVPIASA